MMGFYSKEGRLGLTQNTAKKINIQGVVGGMVNGWKITKKKHQG